MVTKMGLFDILLLKMTCINCGIDRTMEVQVKETGKGLRRYKIGDKIDWKKEGILYGIARCMDCKTFLDVSCVINDFKLRGVDDVQFSKLHYG